MNVFLLIIFVSLIEFIGDSNFKFYARSAKKNNLIIGIIAYAIMIVFIILILKKTNVMYMNGMWDGISAVIESLLAFILLHETLSNRFQYLGLIFIIFGIFAMTIGSIPGAPTSVEKISYW